MNAGATREQTALGETPNLAARLEAIAKPDTIVIADNTRRLVGDRFEYRDLGSWRSRASISPFARGRSSARSASGTDWRRSTRRLPPDRTPTRAKRDAARGTRAGAGLLRDRWQQVTEGEGRVVLLTGDAGIGKSRLVQAFTSGVGERRTTSSSSAGRPTTRTARSIRSSIWFRACSAGAASTRTRPGSKSWRRSASG